MSGPYGPLTHHAPDKETRSSRHLDRAERGRNGLDIHIADPLEHQRVPERCIGLHDQHHHRPQPTASAAVRDLRERQF